jgi:hypothetical protein
MKTATKLDKGDPPINKITGVLPPSNNLVDYEQKGCFVCSCFIAVILIIVLISCVFILI